MRILRALVGALLWIVGGLVGLVAVLLCVTVVLMPVGIPLLMLARRMIGSAVRFMLPRSVSHPVDETSRRLRKKGEQVSSKAGQAGKAAGKTAKKAAQGAAVTRTRKRLGNKRRGPLKKLSR